MRIISKAYTLFILVSHWSEADFQSFTRLLFLVKVTSCDHAFCKTCLMDYSATLGNVSCPSCSVPLTVDLTTKGSVEKVTRSVKGCKRSGILSRLPSLEDFKTSTKIDALVSQTIAIVFYVLSTLLYYDAMFLYATRWRNQNMVRHYSLYVL